MLATRDDAPLLILTSTRRRRASAQERLDKAHPLVRELFAIMALNQASVPLVAERAGLQPSTLWQWLDRSVPHVHNLEAALNVLGYELSIQPIGRGRPKNDPA